MLALFIYLFLCQIIATKKVRVHIPWRDLSAFICLLASEDILTDWALLLHLSFLLLCNLAIVQRHVFFLVCVVCAHLCILPFLFQFSILSCYAALFFIASVERCQYCPWDLYRHQLGRFRA